MDRNLHHTGLKTSFSDIANQKTKTLLLPLSTEFDLYVYCKEVSWEIL